MREMNKPTLVILAAGMGSRYGGLKQLDQIGPSGETIITYSVFDAINAGFGTVVFVIRESFVSEFEEKIVKEFENRIACEMVFQDMDHGMKGIPDIERTKPWGTGHAILCAKDVVDNPFCVINADDFYGSSSFVLMNEFLRTEASPEVFGMIGFKLANTLSPHGPVSRGICSINGKGFLEEVNEHTGIRSQEGGIIGKFDAKEFELQGDTIVSMNMWGFHPALFNELEDQFREFVMNSDQSATSEFYIPSSVNYLLEKSSIRVKVMPSQEKWYGVTYKDDQAEVASAISNMVTDLRYLSPLF